MKSNDSPLQFDERLGVGTNFGSAEETDYLYRLIRKGYKGFFNPEEILVYHPCKKMNIEEEIKKAHSYGMGMGAFFKKHLIRERDFSLIKVFFTFSHKAYWRDFVRFIKTKLQDIIAIYKCFSCTMERFSKILK